MFSRTSLVGIIELDALAGASLGLVAGQTHRFSPDRWRENFAGGAVYPAVLANLGQLYAELDVEFRRLQARLAA